MCIYIYTHTYINKGIYIPLYIHTYKDYIYIYMYFEIYCMFLSSYLYLYFYLHLHVLPPVDLPCFRFFAYLPIYHTLIFSSHVQMQHETQNEVLSKTRPQVSLLKHAENFGEKRMKKLSEKPPISKTAIPL